MSQIKKIILAEDNQADVELIKMAFKNVNLPLEVHHTYDGQELMEYLRSASLDNVALVLLDLNMPRMGGMEVLKALAKDEELKKVPVVVFTSSTHESDVLECYELGANAYVGKPIDVDQFQDVINAIAYFWADINVVPSLVGTV